eukprot:Sdes_comp19330_c0_seq1m10498
MFLLKMNKFNQRKNWKNQKLIKRNPKSKKLNNPIQRNKKLFKRNQKSKKLIKPIQKNKKLFNNYHQPSNHPQTLRLKNLKTHFAQNLLMVLLFRVFGNKPNLKA